MPGSAAAAGTGARRRRRSLASQADPGRIRIANKEFRTKCALSDLLVKYDKNRSHKLERDELVQLLTDTDYSTPHGTKPSDEEVDWIMKVADANGDGSLQFAELGQAVANWETFVSHRQQFEELITKYDAGQNGYLSKDEVTAYLIELNGGRKVTDEEVQMVLTDADVRGDGKVRAIDLQRATAVWYGYVEQNARCCCLPCY